MSMDTHPTKGYSLLLAKMPALPPFAVFDADQQMNIAGPFNTYLEAEQHRNEIFAGAEPKNESRENDKMDYRN